MMLNDFVKLCGLDGMIVSLTGHCLSLYISKVNDQTVSIQCANPMKNCFVALTVSVKK